MAQTPGKPKYKAFISYRHDRTKPFAARLELALKRYAKPLFAPPFKIFRDENHLVPGNDLPSLIYDALADSEYFILLASPESAKSPWVQDEIEYWCGDLNCADSLVIVLLDGDIGVSSDEKTIDWENTNALPETLRPFLKKVPLYVDLRWARTEADFHLAHADFLRAVNTISARIRNIDPNELLGIEVREHKRNIIRRNLAIAVLSFLTITTSLAAMYAWNRHQLATERLQSSLHTAQNIDVLIHDDLERVAGADVIRYKLLENTNTLLKKLGARGNADTTETEAIHLAQQGLITLSHEGPAAARPQFEKAAQMIRGLIDKGNNDPYLKGHLEVIMTHLGDVEVDLGALESAKTIFGQVLESRKERLKRRPSQMALRKVAISHDRIAEVSLRLGDSTDAVTHQNKAITLGRQALDMDQTDAESIRLMAILLLHLGDIEKKTGVSATYMRHYDESGRMLQGLLEQSPFDATVKEDIAVVLERKETEPSLLKSLELRTELSEMEPGNIDWQINCAIAHAQLADFYFEKSNNRTAEHHLRACTKALSTAEQLDNAAPGQKRLIAETLDRVADLMLRTGTQPNEQLKQSLAIKMQLLKQMPKDTVVEHGVAATMIKMADAAASIGDDIQQKKWLDSALQHLTGLRERSPERLDFVRDLATVHDRLADCGNSVEHREKSLTLRQLVAEKQPKNPDAQYELSRSEQELAAILAKTNPKRTAILYSQAESRLNNLLNREMPNPIHLEAMAVLRLRQGDMVPSDRAEEALKLYLRASELFKRVVNNDDPASLIRLATITQRLAEACQRIGDGSLSRRYYNDAAATLANAIHINPYMSGVWERQGEIALAQSRFSDEPSTGKNQTGFLQTFLSESAWQMKETAPRLSWVDTRVDVLAALGNLHIANKTYADAAATVEKILALRQQIISGHVQPRPSEERIALEQVAVFGGLDMVSRLEQQGGEKNAALEALEKRTALARKLAHTPNTDAAWKKRELQAAVDYFNLAHVFKRKDRSPVAARQILLSVADVESDPSLKNDPILEQVKPRLTMLEEIAAPDVITQTSAITVIDEK